MLESFMDIQDAIASRRSVRDFLDKPVDGAVLRRVLELALRAPSGGNVQPWHVHVVGGERMAELKALMRKRTEESPEGEPGEYEIYPKNLWSPYRERRFELGEAMYAHLGIPRGDRTARLRWFARNYQFFGAPVGMFFSIDRGMGPPQWSDLGMLMQTVMLLLRGEGLDSCPQEAWSNWPQTIGSFLQLPEKHMLFSGMSVGYANPEHPVNRLYAARAPLDEVATFLGI
jgi:nitroreductase